MLPDHVGELILSILVCWTGQIAAGERILAPRALAAMKQVRAPFSLVQSRGLGGAINGSYWLLLEPGEPSVCWDPPGFDVDLVVRADTLAMHRVWMGHRSFTDALSKRQIELEGTRELVRAFPDWLALSHFVSVRGVY